MSVLVDYEISVSKAPDQDHNFMGVLGESSSLTLTKRQKCRIFILKILKIPRV